MANDKLLFLIRMDRLQVLNCQHRYAHNENETKALPRATNALVH